MRKHTQVSKQAISHWFNNSNGFQVSLLKIWHQPHFHIKSSASGSGVWYTNNRHLLHFSSFWHWRGAICITFVLHWTTRVVYAHFEIGTVKFGGLWSCEVRETPLTLQPTTGALAHPSLSIILLLIVRGAQGQVCAWTWQVTAATGACGRLCRLWVCGIPYYL